MELDLPKPSYTADAVARMRERWPGHEFALIIGSDNLAGFDRWKDPQEMRPITTCSCILGPASRLHFEESAFADASTGPRGRCPFLTISSTGVRERVSRGQDVGGIGPSNGLAAIRGKGLYQATEDTPRVRPGTFQHMVGQHGKRPVRPVWFTTCMSHRCRYGSRCSRYAGSVMLPLIADGLRTIAPFLRRSRFKRRSTGFLRGLHVHTQVETLADAA